VVLQADELSVLSTVLIAPTSTSARPVWWRPEISVAGQRTRVLVEQTQAIDPTRLGRRVGHLTAEETWAVDDALRAVLALG
jgi:mRNA interferase MazF